MRSFRDFFLLAAIVSALLPMTRASADAVLSGLFSDGAVLQRGVPVPVWGTADDGEDVTVGIASQTVRTTAINGKWSLTLKPMAAGGPYVMTVTGHNQVAVQNVYVGEVWLCSGQSNMGFTLGHAATGPAAVAASADPELHWFAVPNLIADTPQTSFTGYYEQMGPDGTPVQKNVTTPGAWNTVGPNMAANISAVAYFFARDLRKALGVPVGVIESQWGGTPAEAWTSLPALQANPALSDAVTRNGKQVASYPTQLAAYQTALTQYNADKAAGKTVPPNPPNPPRVAGNQRGASKLFNDMINPLIPYAIKGAVWYQGEDNSGWPREYATLLPTMIDDWRSHWGEGNFPFIIVQIPGYTKKASPQESNWAVLRESQLQTSQLLPNVGLVVITKFGEEGNIHPTQKEPVGERVTLVALTLAYGRKDVESSGPVLESVKFDGAKAILTFSHAEGLTTDPTVTGDAAVSGFTLAGADGFFFNADATIQGNTVTVTSAGVASPTKVRYGWAGFPVGNLVNSAGLLASPFRSDAPPLVTLPKS